MVAKEKAMLQRRTGMSSKNECGSARKEKSVMVYWAKEGRLGTGQAVDKKGV